MKKLAKLFLGIIVSSSMIFGSVGVFANTNQVVKVKIGSNVANVNGKNVTMDAVPYIQEYTNVTMIPLRFVATALGIDDNDIIYDAEEKRVTINANKRFNEADQVIYFLNYHMGDYGYAEIKNGRTYIPLRVLCDNLGLSVEWDNVTKTATMKANVSSANNTTNNFNQNNNQTQNASNSATDSTTLTEKEIREMEEEVVKLVNEERVKNGLQPLEISEKLMQSARAKSEDMATRDYSSHIDPDGYSMAKELNVAENIACGNISGTAEKVFNGWMSSEGHRANILNPNYKYIGVGFIKSLSSKYMYYWTQHFSY